MIRKFFKLATLCLTLSGCWLSPQDLLAGQTLSDAGFEGEYVYRFNELNPARRVSITRSDTGILLMYQHPAVNYDAEASRLRTLELGRGYFLVAKPLTYSNYIMSYSLVRRNPDGSLSQYRAQCEDWMVSTPGVTRDARNKDVCAFRTFAALEAVALSSIRRGNLQVQAAYIPVAR